MRRTHRFSEHPVYWSWPEGLRKISHFFSVQHRSDITRLGGNHKYRHIGVTAASSGLRRFLRRARVTDYRKE